MSLLSALVLPLICVFFLYVSLFLTFQIHPKTAKEGEVAEQEQRLKELAPAVKNMERLAADFSANPERILPEAGALETGRSYREKKAKPLLAKIVKVLRALYLAYVELKGKFERLQTDYGQVQKANSRLSERLQEVKLENKSPSAHLCRLCAAQANPRRRTD